MKSDRRRGRFPEKQPVESVNIVARLMMRKNGMLVLNGFGVEGVIFAPDRKSLRRVTWKEGEHCRYVFVTRVVSEKVPGVKFCIFRPLEPRDVCASTRLGLHVAFHERIWLTRVDQESLVFGYQATIADANCSGMKSAVFEIEFGSYQQQIRLERRVKDDRLFQERMYCAWSFRISRSGIIALGSDHSRHGSVLEQLIWVDEDSSRAIDFVLRKYGV